MDFFERWFGFSGGRGDGSLEFIFLVVAIRNHCRDSVALSVNAKDKVNKR
jgi:hypothetical protein